MYLSEIGRAVRDARVGRGLTQARLASIVGVSRATVNALETGAVRELGFGKVDAILRAVGFSLAPSRTTRPLSSKVTASPGRGQGSGRSAFLKAMGKKYIWWQSIGAAERTPDRIIAQVMDLGTFEDLVRLAHAVGKKEMARVLSSARPGWFRPRSFAFWRAVLIPAAGAHVPAFPGRRTDGLPGPV